MPLCLKFVSSKSLRIFSSHKKSRTPVIFINELSFCFDLYDPPHYNICLVLKNVTNLFTYKIFVIFIYQKRAEIALLVFLSYYFA
jgi:hypothetical protein